MIGKIETGCDCSGQMQKLSIQVDTIIKMLTQYLGEKCPNCGKWGVQRGSEWIKEESKYMPVMGCKHCYTFEVIDDS